MTPDSTRRSPRVHRPAVLIGIAVAALAAVLVLPSLTESEAETSEPGDAARVDTPDGDATGGETSAAPAPDDTDDGEAAATSTEQPTTTLSPQQALEQQLAGMTPEEQLTWRLYVASPEEQQAWADFVAPTTTTTAPPPPEPVASAPAPAVSSGSVWDQLAQCEAGGNWAHANGDNFDGGLQFHTGTWRSYGGTAFADRAYNATREQQIVVAERILADVGWGAWPACSRRLGLR